jgi:hypothetical protein
MRPAGDIRRALTDAAQALAAEHGPGARMTWRELASRARVGTRAARHTVNNMVRAGELVRVGPVPTPGCRRPMTTFALATPRANQALTLDAFLRTWPRTPAPEPLHG